MLQPSQDLVHNEFVELAAGFRKFEGISLNQVEVSTANPIKHMKRQKRQSVSFTPQQQLEDAEQEYAEAIYRFRRAEHKLSSDYASSKREMLRLEARVRAIREHIYAGKIFELFEPKQTTNQFIGCPEPAWV